MLLNRIHETFLSTLESIKFKNSFSSSPCQNNNNLFIDLSTRLFLCVCLFIPETTAAKFKWQNSRSYQIKDEEKQNRKINCLHFSLQRTFCTHRSTHRVWVDEPKARPYKSHNIFLLFSSLWCGGSLFSLVNCKYLQAFFCVLLLFCCLPFCEYGNFWYGSLFAFVLKYRTLTNHFLNVILLVLKLR